LQSELPVGSSTGELPKEGDTKMATDAIMVLEKLKCIRESDGTGHSEPFIWPVLVWIDDDTLATPALVGVTAPALGNARVVIKDDMAAGQVADIPSQVGVLRVRLDDNQSVRQLLLTVALWENDETPEKAMRAGYQAFVRELGLAIADNLLALKGATTPQQQKPIIEAIKKRVAAKVESAIRNGLTGSQKIQVFLGTLNLDDIISSDFKSFPELQSQPFSLAFASNGNPASNRYTIDGRLRAVPVVVDPCAAQAARVRDAQDTVNGIEAEIKSLQDQLKGKNPPGEPPLPKEDIIAEIKRIGEEELAPAEEALEEARAALSICRRRIPPNLLGGGVVLNSN
jgi:hypothetical protein